jgi:hypothetical protein
LSRSRGVAPSWRPNGRLDRLAQDLARKQSMEGVTR